MMKHLLCILMLVCATQFVAAQCQLIDATYSLKPVESPVYETVQRINPLDGTRYQSAIPVQMDIYAPQPKPGEGNLLRPAVILCHGAGVRRGDVNMRLLGRSLAQRGYIVASIDYRADHFTQTEIDLVNLLCTSPTCKLSRGIRTLYSNAMDVYKAMSFLLANPQLYPIQPNQFIIGGHSAGAATAYFACNVTKDEVSTHFPSGNPSNFMTDPWYTFADFSLNRPRIRGGLLFSGGTYDLSFTDATDAIPMFIFHGTHDPAAPFYYGRQLCGDATNPILYGGAAIAERMDQFPNHSYYFVEARGVAHSISVHCNDDSLLKPSDSLAMLWYPDMVRFMRTTMLDGYPNQVRKVLTPRNSSIYDYCQGAQNSFCNGLASFLILQQMNSNGTCYSYPPGWPNTWSLSTLPWSGPTFANCSYPALIVSPDVSCGLGGIYGKYGDDLDFPLEMPQDNLPIGFTFSPNPAQVKIDFRISGNRDAPTTISILDLRGVQVRRTLIGSGIAVAEMQLDGLAAGIYLVRAQIGDKVLPTQKLVIGGGNW